MKPICCIKWVSRERLYREVKLKASKNQRKGNTQHCSICCIRWWEQKQDYLNNQNCTAINATSMNVMMENFCCGFLFISNTWDQRVNPHNFLKVSTKVGFVARPLHWTALYISVSVIVSTLCLTVRCDLEQFSCRTKYHSKVTEASLSRMKKSLPNCLQPSLHLTILDFI